MTMANIPRAAALAMFRVHIENGLSVALGVGLTGLLAGSVLGFDVGIAAASGAVCVSISDQPDPLWQKPWILGWALVIAVSFAALVSFSQFWFPPYGFIPVAAFAGLWTGLISAYGRRALSLTMTGVLTLVYAMGRHFPDLDDAFFYLAQFSAGALIYVLYAEAYALIFDDRARRLLLAEAMRSFVVYLRAKAALYDPGTKGPAAFRALIDAYAVLVDRLQAARDAVFSRRGLPLQRKRIDSLIALLDAFDAMLSGDADVEILRRSRRRELKWRINRFILEVAEEVEILTLALRRRHAHVAQRPYGLEEEALLAAVNAANRDDPEDEAIDHAYFVTANKLVVAEQHVAALARALDRDTPPSPLSRELDLRLFQQQVPRGLGVLAEQFDLEKPAMRYGIRLALAMTTGLVLTLIFPRFAHANWILLTIALIMRANYSITRRRRGDRITGTLIGSAVAVGLIAIAPPSLLLGVIVLAIGLSHAFAGVQYRITAATASISSLLLLHFSAPLLQGQFFERVVDTLIGAGLSYAFSYLLPNWERSQLPRLVKSLLSADSEFAEAALSRIHLRQPYRLARKRALEAVAQLSGAMRRLADEPNAGRRTLATLNALLGANYALASGLASMPILMTIRGPDLDPVQADAEILQSRRQVAAILTGSPVPKPIPPPAAGHSAGPKQKLAMTVLASRLGHIEWNARKVARLAARPAIGREGTHAP
jgi:uncharacterized membrane protein YccC